MSTENPLNLRGKKVTRGDNFTGVILRCDTAVATRSLIIVLITAAQPGAHNAPRRQRDRSERQTAGNR